MPFLSRPSGLLTLLAAGVFGLLTLPCGAGAQDLPDPGSWGVGFVLPYGGGSGVGFRRVVGQSTSVGLELGFSVRESELVDGAQERTDSRWSFVLQPDVRFHRADDGPVVPFVELWGRYGRESREGDGSGWGAGAGAGLGADWFPGRGVSVSGSAGLGFSYGRSESGGRVVESWSLDAFRSQLALTLYF